MARPRSTRSCSSGVFSVTCCTCPIPLEGSAFSATAEEPSALPDDSVPTAGLSGLQPYANTISEKTEAIILIAEPVCSVFIVDTVFLHECILRMMVAVGRRSYYSAKFDYLESVRNLP